MESLNIIHATSVHPNTDNRIFNKYVKGLSLKKHNVIYAAQSSSDIESNSMTYIPLKPGNSAVNRLKNNIILFKVGVKYKKFIFHFHDPELIIVGLLLKAIGRKVVYDIHEDNYLGFQQKPYLSKPMKVILSKLIAVAESIAYYFLKTIIAEKAYRYRFPEALEVLNYPVARENSHVNRSLKQGSNINFLYTGSITKDRGAFHHIKLLKLIPTSTLTFVGSIKNELKTELLNSLDSSERRRVIFDTDPVSKSYDEILLHYTSNKYHFGLAIFPKTQHYLDKELTKFFEYPQFGLPVLCSNFVVWKNLIETNNIGVTIEPEMNDLSCEISNMTPDSYTNMVEACKAFSASYSWEKQLEKAIELYKK